METIKSHETTEQEAERIENIILQIAIDPSKDDLVASQEILEHLKSVKENPQLSVLLQEIDPDLPEKNNRASRLANKGAEKRLRVALEQFVASQFSS